MRRKVQITCIIHQLVSINGNKQMYQTWEKAIYENMIDQMMSKITQPSLNWFHFSLIIKEGNIKFKGLNEQLKFRKYFQHKQSVDKDTLKHLMIICETMVTNNKRFFVIKMKESPESILHQPVKCFTWWKELMRKKYGPDLRWFDAIAFKKDTFKIKSFDFKQNLNRILTGTQHTKCAQKICSFFPKNQKNEIQFSNFLNTIKVSSKSTYRRNSTAKKSQSLTGKTQNSTFYKFTQKQPNQRLQRTITQSSQTFYVTEWSPNECQEEKSQKRQNHHMKGRCFRTHVSKTINSFYSVPIKELMLKRELSKNIQSHSIMQKSEY